MVNPNYPEAKLQVSDLQDAATALGVQIYLVNVSSEDAVDEAFVELAQRNIAALLVANDPFLASLREQLVALSRRYAIATIYPLREDAQAGGLISYGTSLPEQVRQGGIYTGRILKGAAPGDLPVLQPTRFTLVINLKTAKALGVDVPSGIMAIADEVIE
jgi:putative ABC transport system substrate-binding protein